MSTNICRYIMAGIMWVFLLCTLSNSVEAQPQVPSCDDNCNNPWTSIPRVLYVSCGSPPCTAIVSVSIWWRKGCTGEDEFLIDGIYQLQGCVNCEAIDILEYAFKDLVLNPPSGASVPIGDQCYNYWRFSTSNCWGAYWEVGKDWPDYLPCSSTCCWTRFRVCKVNGVNKITQGPLGGNINLPICSANSFSDRVSQCESICSLLWDRLPPGSGGGFGTKVATASSQDKENMMNISPNPASQSVGVTFSVDASGDYGITLYDAYGKTLYVGTVTAGNGGSKISQEIDIKGFASGTVYVLVRADGKVIRQGQFTIAR